MKFMYNQYVMQILEADRGSIWSHRVLTMSPIKCGSTGIGKEALMVDDKDHCDETIVQTTK